MQQLRPTTRRYDVALSHNCSASVTPDVGNHPSKFERCMLRFIISVVAIGFSVPLDIL